MINKDDILVVKGKSHVIISFKGCKLIKSLDGLESLSREEIRDLFWKKINGTQEKE